MAAVLMSVVIGISAACGTSSVTATSPSATAPNARSGPASGGALGTIASMSTSAFTMSTPAGQKVTVNETSSTTYQNGSSSTTVSAITTAEYVLVLGTTSGTTITAAADLRLREQG